MLTYVPIQYPGFKLAFRGMADWIALHPEAVSGYQREYLLHKAKGYVRLEDTLTRQYKAFGINGKTIFPD
jgi:hypothetical protein